MRKLRFLLLSAGVVVVCLFPFQSPRAASLEPLEFDAPALSGARMCIAAPLLSGDSIAPSASIAHCAALRSASLAWAA